MDIEEAKKNLKIMMRTFDIQAPDINVRNVENLKKQTIETVLQELESYQIKELQVLNNKLDNISATELQKILQPYCIQKENLERKDKTINELKNKLDNSISKDKLKEIINKYSYICLDGHTMMPKDCYENCIKDIIKLVNFKLLEDK